MCFKSCVLEGTGLPKSQDKCYRGVWDGVRQDPLAVRHSKLQTVPRRGCSYTLERNRGGAAVASAPCTSYPLQHGPTLTQHCSVRSSENLHLNGRMDCAVLEVHGSVKQRFPNVDLSSVGSVCSLLTKWFAEIDCEALVKGTSLTPKKAPHSGAFFCHQSSFTLFSLISIFLFFDTCG